MYFASNLRYLRKKFRLDQSFIAEKLNLNPGTIGAYESGKIEPKLQNIQIISDLFGRTIDELIRKDLSIQEPDEAALTEHSELEALKQEIIDLRKAVEALTASQRKFIEAAIHKK